MNKVDNMEDLVQLDLEQFNEYLGVEAGRQLHTFINHSLLKTAKKGDKESNEAIEKEDTAKSGPTEASAPAPVGGHVGEILEPIELNESSD